MDIGEKNGDRISESAAIDDSFFGNEALLNVRYQVVHN